MSTPISFQGSFPPPSKKLRTTSSDSPEQGRLPALGASSAASEPNVVTTATTSADAFNYASQEPPMPDSRASDLNLLAEAAMQSAQDAVKDKPSLQAPGEIRQKLFEHHKEAKALMETLQQQLEKSQLMLQKQKEKLAHLYRHMPMGESGVVAPDDKPPVLTAELQACHSAYGTLKKQLKVFPHWFDRIQKQKPHGQRVAHSLHGLNLLLNNVMGPKHDSLMTEIEIQDLAAGLSKDLQKDSLALMGSGTLLASRIAALREDEALQFENQPAEGSPILKVLAEDLRRTADKLKTYQESLAALHLLVFNT